MILMISRRRSFLPSSLLALLLVFALYARHDLKRRSARARGLHVIRDYPNIDHAPVDSHGFLQWPVAEEFCSYHNFGAYSDRSQRRKVYDLFLINTELDWLEIRLNQLYDHVDWFVILESNTTFTGLPKELHVHSNWEKFAKFHDKIILRTLDSSALNSSRGASSEDLKLPDWFLKLDTSLVWKHEDLQRDALYDQILTPDLPAKYEQLTAKQTPNYGDVIVLSDLDEIPRSSTIQLLRNCQTPPRLTLRSRFYYYSYQWLHVGEEWAHPQATTFRGVDTIRPTDLRSGRGYYAGRNYFTTRFDEDDIWNSSWHCSSCFRTIKEVERKIDSFSHVEYNKPLHHKQQHIIYRFRNGLDLFDRPTENYTRIPRTQQDVPTYLTYHEFMESGSIVNITDRFKYLMDRDPENANFEDYIAGT